MLIRHIMFLKNGWLLSLLHYTVVWRVAREVWDTELAFFLCKWAKEILYIYILIMLTSKKFWARTLGTGDVLQLVHLFACLVDEKM